MIRNHLLIALRHLSKRKFLSTINIVGLATGMAFTWLIVSYVVSELLVNNTLRHAGSQYIVRSNWQQPGMGFEDATVAPLGKLLRREYPALVANYYRFDVVTTVVTVGNRHFSREPAEAGDPTLLAMYGFPMLHGDPNTALKAPNSIVLTEEYARKYFGRTDVLGRTLSLSNYVGGQQLFTVTGVLTSLPRNSVTYLWDQPVHLFIPLNSLKGRTDTDGWDTHTMVTHVELQAGVDAADLTGPIQRLLAAYAPTEVRENLHAYLTPLPAYYRAFNQGIVQKTIYTLSGIGLFVLFMAAVNFMTITTVGGLARIRELGVRKSLGGQRSQLMQQLLTESVVVTALALALSLLLYELFRFPFADVLGKRLDSLWTAPVFFPATVLLLSALIGLAAGAYPAVRLTALASVDALKGRLKTIQDGQWFRRSLITAQFFVALLVFCGALIVAQQVTYVFNQNMGYNNESMLLVSLPRDWTPQGVARMEHIRDELARLPNVTSASITSQTLKGGTGYDVRVYPVGRDSTTSVAVSLLQTDEHFTQTYQIPMVAGRFYRSAESTEHADKLVLSWSAIRLLGYKTAEAAIGKQVRTLGYGKPITIIGVAGDFGFRSLKEKMPPVAISHVKGAGNLFSHVSIKLGTRHVKSALDAVERRFHQLLPDAPFDVYFADESVQQLYQAELQLKKASQVATGLALLIVLVGVVGLVSLSVARRTKELAVRKVLGAGVPALINLFLGEFTGIFAVAALLALPAAFLLMSRWLQTFAYHVEPSWFALAAVGLLFFGLVGLVVGLQTAKTALANPVRALRSE